MASDEAPFRFKDLPAELRLKVFEKCFERTILTTCEASRDNYGLIFPKVGKDDIFGFPNSLPSILFVSKAMREEAMPMFSRQAALGLDQDSAPNLTDIPDYYVAGTTTAYVHQEFVNDELVDERLLPKLRELHLLTTSIMGSRDYSYRKFYEEQPLVEPWVHVEDSDEESENEEEDNNERSEQEVALDQADLVLRESPAGPNLSITLRRANLPFKIHIHIVLSAEMPPLRNFRDREECMYGVEENIRFALYGNGAEVEENLWRAEMVESFAVSAIIY